MRRRVLLLLLFGWILSACGFPTTEALPTDAARPSIDEQSFPAFDASTSAEPILAGIYCEFLNVPCEWMDWPISGGRRYMPKFSDAIGDFSGYKASGTHEAYLNLINRQADLIVVARKPSADEWVQSAIQNVEFKIEPIALDAFIFIVNDQNPVAFLTTDQIRKIYSGKLKDWKDAGGPAGDIHPYLRDPNSGSQELMVRLVMRSTPMIDAPEMTLPTMHAPFYAVSEDPQGIGYSIYYYEEHLAPLEEKVKPIGIDGVSPGSETIANREYPYTTEVFVVIRKDQTGIAEQLFNWLRSPEGQILVAETGYQPLYPPK